MSGTHITRTNKGKNVGRLLFTYFLAFSFFFSNTSFFALFRSQPLSVMVSPTHHHHHHHHLHHQNHQLICFVWLNWQSVIISRPLSQYHHHHRCRLSHLQSSIRYVCNTVNCQLLPNYCFFYTFSACAKLFRHLTLLLASFAFTFSSFSLITIALTILPVLPLQFNC